LRQRLVAVGQQVARGQAIGEVGSTGRSTGPHLHYEVEHQGRIIDPTKALATVSWR
jgi:murein DD-endopeptidase MepM/ murein hydrolase activator NlpD